MRGTVTFRNPQRTRKINVPFLRRVIAACLEKEFDRSAYELGVYLVGGTAITELNERFLQHEGSTDVITFDYCDPVRPERLVGDIFVCVPEAVRQARQFHTTWQNEIVRYVVHGVLHLCGYDDRVASRRKRMKLEEDRLVAKLARQFDLNKLANERRTRARVKKTA